MTRITLAALSILAAATFSVACQTLAAPTPPPPQNPFQGQNVDLFTTCYDELKHQLIIQKKATNADHFNQLVGHILINRADCLEHHWSPTATNASHSGMCGELILLTPHAIQGQTPPRSFLTAPKLRAPLEIETYSYRDENNNIRIHWMRRHRPDNEANCWLYLHKHGVWFTE